MTKGEGPPLGSSCSRFLYPRLAGGERIESRFSWSRRRKSSNSSGQGSRLLFASIYDFSSPRLTNRLLTLDSTIGMTFNLKSPAAAHFLSVISKRRNFETSRDPNSFKIAVSEIPHLSLLLLVVQLDRSDVLRPNVPWNFSFIENSNLPSEFLGVRSFTQDAK